MRIYHKDNDVQLLLGDTCDVMSQLPDGCVDCIVTSPPYFNLRNYDQNGQYGNEPTQADYVETMRRTFDTARRLLSDAGTLWLNIGDSYNGTGSRRDAAFEGTGTRNRPDSRPAGRQMDPKNRLGTPWRVAFALQDDGWILRNDIIWYKPNPMPESITDRMSTRFEYIFLFSKSPRYHLRLDSYRMTPKTANMKPKSGKPNKYAANGMYPGHSGPNTQHMTGERTSHPKGVNPGDVWSIATQPMGEGHPAPFPLELPSRCVAMGCPPGGTVLDPFSGSATTGLAALRFRRKYIGIDVSEKYHEIALNRLAEARR